MSNTYTPDPEKSEALKAAKEFLAEKAKGQPPATEPPKAPNITNDPQLDNTIPKANETSLVAKITTDATIAAADILAENPVEHLNIPKPTDNLHERIDNEVSSNCRRALMHYFDEHTYNKQFDPMKRRLLELVAGDDLDNESKQELTRVFVHEPPPTIECSIKAKPLDSFKRPVQSDPGELLKHRYLCRGGGLLIVGATGYGKSSLAMQLAIKWALGEPVFGLEPARPLKSLLIQAENDDGDLAEMKDGVFNGLNLSQEDEAKASGNIMVYTEKDKVGQELFEKTITPLLIDVKPDLLWIDPALSYIGGDMSSQEMVGKFLRNQLNPVLANHNCGGVVIHHTNKPITNPNQLMIDPAYLGAGSAEWANWARAVLALRKTDVANLYELVAGKRGARLKWKAADGETMSVSKYIGHCKRADTICWIEMAVGEAEEMKANNGKTADDVLKHVPQTGLLAKDDLISICRKNGIGKNAITDLLKELIDNEELFEHHAKRLNARPKVLLSREPNTSKEHVMLDLYTRNSSGIYFKPANN